MKPRTRLAILFLLGALTVPAQEVSISTRYLELQEAYTRRLQEIETQYRKTEQELLNRFILSLPRIERQFQDEGVLEGVVAARDLQEELLTHMRFPDPEGEYPGVLGERVQTLLEERAAAEAEHQARLDALNRILHDALEPYKVAFTKAGELENAMEVRAIQLRLAGELDLEDGGEEEADGPVTVSTDPNAFAFCLEPAGYGEIPGVTPREPAIPFTPKIDGDVRIVDKGFQFREGKLTIPAPAMRVLLDRVKRNQMLTFEFGYQPWGERQGDPVAPAVIFLYGKSLKESNLALTQEARNLFLYIRTTIAPEGHRPYHRIHLGRAEDGRAQHYAVTFRSGELTVFKDGSEFKKLRGEPKGLMSNWEEYPVIMGEIPGPPDNPDFPEIIHWRGHMYQFYMRPTLENAREISESYNRFGTAVTR